ncbi:MAG: response regulator transcription factor [Prosthecobacter sp.]|nr:response regulator transcription factor [Prosthecobacter sp.]
MKSIWIVEDHAPFRRTITSVFNAETDLHCPRAFESCEAMLAELPQGSAPDVLLLDVGLPGMSGLDGIRAARAASPTTLVLVLTVFNDDEKIFRAICAGACGYLLKTSSAADVVRAVRDALAGGSPMNPRVARRVLTMFSQFAPKKVNYSLSERETEVLKLMVAGLIRKEIADKLSLSIHTVDTYVRRIYEKLEVSTCSSAVAKALNEGIG